MSDEYHVAADVQRNHVKLRSSEGGVFVIGMTNAKEIAHTILGALEGDNLATMMAKAREEGAAYKIGVDVASDKPGDDYPPKVRAALEYLAIGYGNDSTDFVRPIRKVAHEIVQAFLEGETAESDALKDADDAPSCEQTLRYKIDDRIVVDKGDRKDKRGFIGRNNFRGGRISDVPQKIDAADFRPINGPPTMQCFKVVLDGSADESGWIHQDWLRPEGATP